MTPVPLPLSRNARTHAFSLVEIICVVAVLGLIVAVVVPGFGSMRSGVERTKLSSDVAAINRAVAVFVSEGGSMEGVTTPEQVIERLKTRTSSDDVRRHLGVSGRLSDSRLAARSVSKSEIASGAPRATWDASLQKFVISNSGAGIADFYFDDKLADAPIEDGERNASKIQYNGQDGWVWAWGGHADKAPLSPDAYALSTPSNPPGSGLDLTTPPGGGSPGGGSVTPPPPPPAPPQPLPIPNITPKGGIFNAVTSLLGGILGFPNTITIHPGNVEAGSSILQYRLNSGSWKSYTGNFSVTPGTTVYARNLSLDSDLYIDSGIASESYYSLVDSFSGSVTPKWVNIKGPSGMVHTIDNSNAGNVKATYGKATSDGAVNSLNFQRVGFSGIKPDKDFKIGTVTYFNGTINNGTEANSIDLQLDVNITAPSTLKGAATAKLTLWSSPNTNNDKESADWAQLENPKTDFAVQVNGITYTLELKFANISVVEGWTDGQRLWVYEGSNGKADLIARFVSSKQ